MISAKEANEWARKNSQTFTKDYKRVSDSIDQAIAEGKFKAEVTVEYANRNAIMRDLEAKGFIVETIKQGIYPTNAIEIQW